MKKLLRKALVCLPTVIALYTAADFLYCTFIKRIKYVFCVKKLIKPVTVWLIFEAVMFLAKKTKQMKQTDHMNQMEQADQTTESKEKILRIKEEAENKTWGDLLNSVFDMDGSKINQTNE